jgi:hypothetical protein
MNPPSPEIEFLLEENWEKVELNWVSILYGQLQNQQHVTPLKIYFLTMIDRRLGVNTYDHIFLHFDAFNIQRSILCDCGEDI